MNRTNQINEAFKKLRFEPRNNQVDIVNRIIHEFVDQNKRNVILCADTGIGKSIIAAVTAEVLSTEIPSDAKKGIYVSSTNSLVDQYANTFKDEPISDWHRIKGASNYPCVYFREKGNLQSTGEDCVIKDITEQERQKFCSNCTYKSAKAAIYTTQNLITNYSYFMVGNVTTHHLRNTARRLHVFDEAHLLNDQFCEQFSIHISVETLNRYIAELKNQNGKMNSYADTLTEMRDRIAAKQIKETNYVKFISELRDQFIGIHSKMMWLSSMIPDLMVRKKMQKAASKYDKMGCRMKAFFNPGYEHVFEDKNPNEITIKPIFVSDSISDLLGEKNLFMTATMSMAYAKDTMSLPAKDTAYIDAGTVFSPQNRPLFFLGKRNLNYTTMQNEDTFTRLSELTNAIISHHKNEKGIMLTPSFSATEKLCRNLKGTKVFEHKSGTKVSEIIDQFKSYKGSAILISPSIFEGLDFKDDHSRYQIIMKTPYPSLGDKRMKYICDVYGHVYREIGLYKIIQGVGRSIRSETDTATTYFLDKSSQTLFESDQNLWADRFDVKVTA